MRSFGNITEILHPRVLIFYFKDSDSILIITKLKRGEVFPSCANCLNRTCQTKRGNSKKNASSISALYENPILNFGSSKPLGKFS